MNPNPVHRGVYAVGRPELTHHGRWMAAVLACGPGAVLSHDAAAALWELAVPRAGAVDVSVPGHARGRESGIVVHRRPWLTLVDSAARRGRAAVEAAINEADKRDVVDPETLRAALDGARTRPGLGPLREVLDRRTFTPLRFTRAQVRYEPEHVQATLAAVAGRLGGR